MSTPGSASSGSSMYGSRDQDPSAKLQYQGLFANSGPLGSGSLNEHSSAARSSSSPGQLPRTLGGGSFNEHSLAARTSSSPGQLARTSPNQAGSRSLNEQSQTHMNQHQMMQVAPQHQMMQYQQQHPSQGHLQIVNSVEGQFQIMNEMHTQVEANAMALSKVETSISEQRASITHLEQAAKTTAHQINEQKNNQTMKVGVAAGLGVLGNVILQKILADRPDTPAVLHRAHCSGAKSSLAQWQRVRTERPWHDQGPEPTLSPADHEYCDMYRPPAKVRLGAAADFALLAIGTAALGWMFHKLGTVLRKGAEGGHRESTSDTQ
eukprot:TRINITY_DN1438_c0_g1_i3.p1 TRINITY_DN1438_c0_g1~~TRINITY_DN1438_c0_g1_i3.p1  ORF type:complete len:321 (-),score=59.04 TRINITY_DN1438_c0_g1_i3:297-1259(-)